MKILHLPGSCLWNYSKSDFEDIFGYFEPDVLLTSDMNRSQKRKIDGNFSYESIHLDEVKSVKQRYIGEEVLLIVEEMDPASRIEMSEIDDREVILLTDLIKEEMDPKSFEYRLVNTSLIEKIKGNIDDLHILSTAIEAGKSPFYEDVKVHGLGLSDDLGDPKIPCVITDEGIHIETLNANKVGISAVPGLGRRFSSQLERHGVRTRSDLCSIDPDDILECDGIGPYRSTKWISSAKAIEESEVYRIEENDLGDKHRIFIDIETDSLNPSIIWHIGVFDDEVGEYEYFLEKKPDKKDRIIKDFLERLEENICKDSVLLAWYGEKFDFEHLENFIRRYAPEKISIWNKVEKEDFMRWTDRHAALPCRSSKLDSVARRLGYEPEITGLDGSDVGRIYSEYMIDGDREPDWKELKLYGKEDVMEMKFIYDRIVQAPMLYDMGEVEKRYSRK